MAFTITEPTLLLNEDICKSNIQKMAQKAREKELRFKPHMKTHQSSVVGQWFKEEGVNAITVSSVKMARYFSEHGWHDITIAFPVNINQVSEIDTLASSISLTLLASNKRVIDKLENEVDHEVGVYIELDTGGNRSGLKPEETDKIKNLVFSLKKTNKLHWQGFYSHPGHSYQARSENEIIEVHHSVIQQIKQLRHNLPFDKDEFEICIGDTPCCSVAENFEGIDAISPGNFVFYDLMQLRIGSCRLRDIAVAMACPVVDKYPNRKELVIYGGAIHFSKEFLENRHIHYGRVATEMEKRWQLRDQATYLKTVSQEHGIVHCSKESFDHYQIGDTITILPVHSCLTANLMGTYTLGTDQIVTQL